MQSFTRAAKQMYMSQPAVSFQIKALEENLGVTLFVRDEKKVFLTDAGRLLYPEAKRMLGQYDKIKTGLESLRGLKSGQLTVGAGTIPGEYLMPVHIGMFRKKHPGIKIKLRISGSGDVLRWVRDREIDIAVVGSPTGDASLEQVPWLDDELVLIVPAEHRFAGKEIDIGELAGEKFVLREEGSGTRRSIAGLLEEHGYSLELFEIEMELGSTRAVIGAVQAGLGIGFVSRLAAAEAIQLGKVGEARLKNLDLGRKLYIVRYQPGITSYAADAFYKFLLRFRQVSPDANGAAPAKE